jgi:Zn-dependent peptidase ImmA (M78 family)/DNA-binding XRE family transcriptional regulator
MGRSLVSNVETARWIGIRLRDARRGQGMTQEALAQRARVSQSAIAMWEKGRRTPRVEELVQLADALEEDVATFLPRLRELEPLRAVLRAETTELDQGKLGRELERVVDLAEEVAIPRARISVRATDPHSAAQELLTAASVEGPPVKVARIAHLCGVRVVASPLADALSGAILGLEDGPVIAVNESQAPGRQRFTIAHELGHHLLRHHDRFHVDLSAHTEVGEPPGYNWLHEREANEFAADLLMPAAMVRREATEAKSPRTLARRFQVSPMAMSYRLVNLRLDLSSAK